MFVVRKRSGYTIRCTEGDFAMLEALLDATPADAQRRILKGTAKASHTRRIKGGALLRIDEDRLLKNGACRVKHLAPLHKVT